MKRKIISVVVFASMFVLGTFVLRLCAQVCVSPPSGIVAWWPAEGNANDIIGGNNGTLEAGVTFAPGEVGQAFQFNGTAGGGGVNLGDVPAFNFTPSSSFTIDAWVNSFAVTAAPNDAQMIVSLNFNCSNTAQNLAISGGIFAERATFQVRDANGVSAGPLFSPTPLSKNTFHHVAGVRQVVGLTKTVSLYVDGVLVATAADPTTGALDLSTPDFIGRINICGPATNTFNGLIDEVEVFNRALTAAEIVSIFNAGSAGKCKTPQTPQQATQSIINAVNGLGLNSGVTNSLIVKLQAAIDSMNAGNNTAARNQLQAFINEVNALVNSGMLSASDAQPLIDAANNVIARIP